MCDGKEGVNPLDLVLADWMRKYATVVQYFSTVLNYSTEHYIIVKYYSTVQWSIVQQDEAKLHLVDDGKDYRLFYMR